MVAGKGYMHAPNTWVRRPHARRARQRCIGPSLIVAATLVSYRWGWVIGLKLVGVKSPMVITFYAVVVEGAGICAMYCLWALLKGDPTSTTVWQARHPKAPTSECAVCGLQRPEDAHHCRTCDACVVEHDHHCGILGVCIGHGNRKTFIALLALGSFAFSALCVECALTYDVEVQHGHAADVYASYALPGLLFLIGAVVLGIFAILQVALVYTGLRLKTKNMCSALVAALMHRPPPTASYDEDDDQFAEPGCCACIQASHDAGLDGIFPGVGSVATFLLGGMGEPGAGARNEEASRGTHLRIAAAIVALLEWLIASLLWLGHLSSSSYPVPTPVALTLIALTAWGSVIAIQEVRRFQESVDALDPDPRYNPPSAASVRASAVDASAAGGDAAAPAAPSEDDEPMSADELLVPSERRPLAKGEPRDEAAADEAAGTTGSLQQGIEWCTACDRYVRRPSAHCRACGKCIEYMDHHCTLLRLCVGASNRYAYCRMLALGLAVASCHSAIALLTVPHACAGVVRAARPLFDAALGTSDAASTHSWGTVAWLSGSVLAAIDLPSVAQCAPVAALTASGLYAVPVLASFGLQQLVFVLLVVHGLPKLHAHYGRAYDDGEAQSAGAVEQRDLRLWLLRNVVPIPYWRRQRLHLLRRAAGGQLAVTRSIEIRAHG